MRFKLYEILYRPEFDDYIKIVEVRESSNQYRAITRDFDLIAVTENWASKNNYSSAAFLPEEVIG